jgi:hypothetical protein
MRSSPLPSWKFVFGFLLAALVESSAFCQAPIDRSLNLLTNGDFQQGMDGWELLSFGHQGQATVVAPGKGLQDALKPVGSQGAAATDPAEVNNGKPSLKIENISDDDTAVNQKVKVKPATRYRLSGWIKTKSVEWKQAKGKRGASLCIMGGFESSEPIGKTKGWTHVYYEVASGTRSELVIGARLGMYASPVRGTAWFSDLSLTEIGPSH